MTRDIRAMGREVSAGVAYGLGVVAALLGVMYMYLRFKEVAAREGLRDTLHLEDAVSATTEATRTVHAEVARLATETARAQRLAILVGIGTTVLGALVGGFAGAFAARVIGS